MTKEERQLKKRDMILNGNILKTIIVISLPILLETSFILHLWLGDSVPEYAGIFTQLVLLTAFVSAFANPTSCIAYATGNIKIFSMVVSVANLMILPLAYLFLKLGYGPTSAFWVSLVITIIVQVLRLMVVSKITVLKVRDYMKQVVFPVVVYSILTICGPISIKYLMNDGWLRLLLVLGTSVVSSLIFVWLVGLNKFEKEFVASRIGLLKRIK